MKISNPQGSISLRSTTVYEHPNTQPTTPIFSGQSTYGYCANCFLKNSLLMSTIISTSNVDTRCHNMSLRFRRHNVQSSSVIVFSHNVTPVEKCSFQEHEKGKYVSLLKASESEEQGMKKANIFLSSKRNKVRNKAWKGQICFLAQSIRKRGTRHEKGKYVSFLQV